MKSWRKKMRRVKIGKERTGKKGERYLPIKKEKREKPNDVQTEEYNSNDDDGDDAIEPLGAFAEPSTNCEIYLRYSRRLIFYLQASRHKMVWNSLRISFIWCHSRPLISWFLLILTLETQRNSSKFSFLCFFILLWWPII